MTSYYRTGTITVTNGSKAVTGSSTSFLNNISQGDILIVGGVMAVVDTITDATNLTLLDNWTGTTATGTASYAVLPTGADHHSTVTFNSRMSSLLDQLAGTVQGGGGGGSSSVALAPLSLSNTTVQENSAAGVVVGAVQGKTSGSTLSLTNTAGGKFALNAQNQIVTGSSATDYETATYHDITITETYAGASNSPRDTTIRITVLDVYEGPVVTLNALSLSANQIQSGSAAGTVVGTVGGNTSGSTMTLVDNAGGRFSIVNGNQIVAGNTSTNYSTATSHNITVRETYTGATNSPRDTTFTIQVTQAAQVPSLSALTLSALSIQSGSPQGTVVGSVQGKTSGSTLALTVDAGGRFQLDSSNRIVAGATATNYSTATSHQITIRETLAGSSNSPRDTTITINVTQAQTATTLASLSLSPNQVTENTGPGVVIGSIQGKTSGSSLSLSNDAGGRFSLSGTNIVTGSVATDYETAHSYTITVVETLSGATNSPKTNNITITVLDVNEGNTLYGFPDAASTGVRQGVALTKISGYTHTTPNSTISGKDINGTLTIQANGVTVRDCRLSGDPHCILIPDGYTCTVEYCDIVGPGNGSGYGISGAGTFQYNDISNVENGVTTYDTSVIQHNYIHDLLNASSSDPHYDCVQCDTPGGHLIYHNTMINTFIETSAVMLSTDYGSNPNNTIDSNYLCGGGYTIYSRSSSNKITNNYLGQGGQGSGYLDDGGAPPTYTGNIELGRPPWPAFSSATGSGGTSTTLGTLSLSPATIQEHSASGTVVGAISGKSSGSSLTLQDNAGGRFAISGNNIVTTATATDYATATGHAYSITIRETLTGATNTPHDTTISIAVTQAPVNAGTESLWYPSATPSGGVSNEAAAGITLATVIHFSVDGQITKVAYYRASASASPNITVGIHRMDDASGTMLAQKSLSGQTGTGWKVVTLDTPVSVTAGMELQINAFQPAASGQIYYTSEPYGFTEYVISPNNDFYGFVAHYDYGSAYVNAASDNDRNDSYPVDVVFTAS